ncbi:hypothetical protein NX722_21380 [Endozoicomonas gorgoniicola]|uniref:Uncharacterized protein n=1 Tax=Endozoicomonas gorgoniicola TaxID=1234144 RepID=A0ABT3N0H5_9GAMM|nr:hypothetical protein [Endozoicomonas gorgoniicola]MCW7555129.1 hypothetical protein [Endozoicomonas gorgoniicola]
MKTTHLKQGRTQISELLSGATSKEPDAIHLHLDHRHDNSGEFLVFFNDLEQYAKAHNLNVTMREDSNQSPVQYPPIERTSVMEIMIGSSDLMRKFINYAAETYPKYMNENELESDGTCLFIHPQYTSDENNPVDQYIYHYKHAIMLSNPNNCFVSHNYTINLRNRLADMKAMPF